MLAFIDQPTTLGYIFKTQGGLVDAKRFVGVKFRHPMVYFNFNFLLCLKQFYSEKGN